MSHKFKKEVRSIEIILQGSRWAHHPEVKDVLKEYSQIVAANSVHSRERRVALQILHSSRAIDTLLAHIVRTDCATRRETPQNYYTLESSLSHLRNRGLASGNRLPQQTFDDLEKNVKNKRNLYLHTANKYPQDVELNRFLSSTANGMRVISGL